MAKDTEKLIRQLSLISYLMAERRPVTALEIRRDVEGYSAMNEDAFARRFYADRSELDSLGIALTVEQPVDGVAEQENYSLRPENFHLPAIAFTDAELAALQTALSLLDGEFAYAEPLRLALQQISWGRPNPLRAPEQRARRARRSRHPPAATTSPSASRRSRPRSSATRRSRSTTTRWRATTTGTRKVDPYHLLFQGGQFYLLGHAHERDALRVFRLSRIRGKVAYATKAEHDFQGPPEGFDPRAYANRADWQFGEPSSTAEIRISERIAWQIERHFGRFGEIRPAGTEQGDVVFATQYADRRQLAAWVLRLGEHARVLGPPELEREVAERVELLDERHRGAGAASSPPPVAATRPRGEAERRRGRANGASRRTEAAIRPERFARLVTLASILIQAGRAGVSLDAAEVCERLQISDAELREDINVLNVVNFGGGSYVLYAEINDDGEIEVDPEPYADNFARPARLLPVEAKALVAAIDLIGEHLPEGSLAVRAREDRRRARRRPDGAGPAGRRRRRRRLARSRGSPRRRSRAPPARARLLQGQRGRVLQARRRALRAGQRPRGLVRRLLRPRARRRAPLPPGPHPPRRGHRRARSSRGPRSTRPPTSTAGCAPARSRRRGSRASGSRPSARAGRARSAASRRSSPTARSIVELSFKGTDFLVRDVLAEAGDAAVLEPAEAREAVLAAVAALRARRRR